MKLLSVHQAIYQFDSLSAFTEAFCVSCKDAVLTNRCVLSGEAVAALNGAHCIWQEDYGTGEPTDEMINGIRAELTKRDFRRIIAIGGGTVLDIAKLLVLPAQTPLESYLAPDAVYFKQRELLLLPTTCGTGSEMTNIAIVTFVKSGIKQGIVSDALYADAAVLIASMIDALPEKPFAASLIDALIHSVESFLSPKATAYTRMFSQEAMRLILEGVQEIAQFGMQARKKYNAAFLQASNLAGIAFGNAGCGAVHAMSYPLGASYHVPHGFSNYTLFLAVLRCYKALAPHSAIAQLQKVLAQLLACPEESVYNELERLLACLHPFCPMHSYGATEADISHFVEVVQQKQGRLMANACVPLNGQALLSIYQSVF